MWGVRCSEQVNGVSSGSPVYESLSNLMLALCGIFVTVWFLVIMMEVVRRLPNARPDGPLGRMCSCVIPRVCAPVCQYLPAATGEREKATPYEFTCLDVGCLLGDVVVPSNEVLQCGYFGMTCCRVMIVAREPCTLSMLYLTALTCRPCADPQGRAGQVCRRCRQ